MKPLPFLTLTAMVLTATTTFAQATHNQLTDAEKADGWIQLFDGESLYGWRSVGEANFEVTDGVIHVDSGDVCLLRTTTQFSDYVLKVDFRNDADTNSGIFLRTSPKPAKVEADCYELNIAPPDNPFPTASLVKRAKVSDDIRATVGEWHTYEVTMNGPQVTIVLDGQQVLDYTDPSPAGRGFIGLQHNQGKVEFRNVKLKPLGLGSIFNGTDLSGWKTYPEMDSKFSVNEKGHLHVQNGRGQLETEGSYGDFVLQVDCYSNGKELNSGIFFRCIPGDTMMGYESQIHNGFKDGDRSQPVDCGTGGIFRRKNARKVVSDDFDWFRKTLIAEGPHIAVWIDGQQVTDWTDQRKPHANPRKGLRKEPGTLMIQGHDPTTDLSFRNIVVGEMNVRRPK